MTRDLTPGHGQDLLAAYKHAREECDPDAAMAMLSEQIELRLDPFEAPLNGHLEVRAYWNALAAAQSEVEFDAEQVWVVGRTVLCDWHAGYDTTSSTVRVRERGFLMMDVDDDGLVSRIRLWTITRP
jgi:hypothetical protein